MAEVETLIDKLILHIFRPEENEKRPVFSSLKLSGAAYQALMIIDRLNMNDCQSVLLSLESLQLKENSFLELDWGKDPLFVTSNAKDSAIDYDLYASSIHYVPTIDVIEVLKQWVDFNARLANPANKANLISTGVSTFFDSEDYRMYAMENSYYFHVPIDKTKENVPIFVSIGISKEDYLLGKEHYLQQIDFTS